MSTKTRLQLMLDAGEVRRFHANRVIKDRTVGQHVYNMLVLADNYFNSDPPPELMKAILYHDAHEAITGDIPWPTKQMHPVLRELETEIDKENNLVATLTPDLGELLKRIDMLEFYIYLLDEEALGNRNNTVEKYRAFELIVSPGMPESWYRFVDGVTK